MKALPISKRKPRDWAPFTPEPNNTVGVLTRAKKIAILEYEQQAENEAAIQGVLDSFGAEEADIYLDAQAPESQHAPGSMDNCNINLWDTVFCDDRWRHLSPVMTTSGFNATHPGGTLQKPNEVAYGDMPAHLHGIYVDWSSERANWAVLVPNRFLSEASFHT